LTKRVGHSGESVLGPAIEADITQVLVGPAGMAWRFGISEKVRKRAVFGEQKTDYVSSS
jgi:hypothetical protein